MQIRYLILAAVVLTLGVVLERSLRDIRLDYDKLMTYKESLKEQKDRALALKQQLESQIMSQSDPQWITLTLIRELGVVPEGYTKVYFKEPAVKK